MKQLLLYLFIHISFCANAQQAEPKFIEVNGSAEINLKPDEVEFEVNLTQYYDGKKLVDIDDVEKQFYAVLQWNGISTKALTADNGGIYASYSYYYWWHWWYYYRNYTDRRVVRFTVKQNTDILKLLKDFNGKKWLANLTIIGSKSTEITRYRKQVKIEAMKAAKDKAGYLLESVGEELGGLISVTEVPEQTNTTGTAPYYDPYGYGYYGRINQPIYQQSSSSNVVLNAGSMSGGGTGGETGIQNMAEIKIRYEIKAKFQIK